MNAAMWVCSLLCLVAVSLHSPYMDFSSLEHRAGLTATDGEEMLATLKTVNRLLTSDSYAVCTDPVQAGVDAACAPGISSSFKVKFSKLSYK